MPTLLLVRHGETDWNRAGQIMGERPVPLNARGEAQAAALAAILQPGTVRLLASSPVARAQQTAAILASALELPLVTDRGLTEIGAGEWEGRFWSELADDLVRHHFYSRPHESRPPGGETLGEVQARAIPALHRLIEQAPGRDDRLLVVSHADVLRTILAHYLELDLRVVRQIRIDHASVTAIALHEGLADVLFVNHTPSPEGLR